MIKVVKKKYLVLFLFTMANAATLFAQQNKPKIKWLSPTEMSALYEKEKKPILVDVYTNWCHYCKVMDNTTWKNDSVAAYLNSHFYNVKIDAESKTSYLWLGKVFNYDANYKVNNLAVKLLGVNMSYPSTVFIPVKGGSEVVSGAFSAQELEIILKYYGQNKNETTTPEQFQKAFVGVW